MTEPATPVEPRDACPVRVTPDQGLWLYRVVAAGTVVSSVVYLSWRVLARTVPADHMLLGWLALACEFVIGASYLLNFVTYSNGIRRTPTLLRDLSPAIADEDA